MPSEVIFKIDTQSIERLALRLVGTGKTVRVALARAVNHTGDKARTQVVRALVKQTGAKYGVIRKALKTKRANAATITFQIIGRGGFMSLKEFGARQTSKGVSAAPWNERRVFPHTFIVPSLGGHVFERIGGSRRLGPAAGRLPIRKLWGPAIPKEMVKEKSKEAFETTVAAELPSRVAHEVEAIIGGLARDQ